MPRKKHQLAVAMIDGKGNVEFVPQTDVRFPRLATAVAGQWFPATYGPEPSPYASPHQTFQRLLGGSQNLRQLLIPRESDFDAILDRIMWYNQTNAWVNRALYLRSAFNASEIDVHAPRNDDQTAWMRGLSRELRFFSFAREWFWQLNAFGQVITLWKTTPGGNKPLSIECADLHAHQPRGPGLMPRIVVIPGKVEALKKLADESRMGGKRGERAKAKLNEYPPPLRDAVMSPRMEEVDAKDLEPYGYHLEYASLSRRHHEDWAFPGMYAIFGDIEMLEMARAVDINSLAQYKAAILLVRLGPENPGGNDLPVMATEPQLKKIEAAIMAQARNKFPTLVARGDLSISFVTPPVEVFNLEKYKSAAMNVLDWLGIPKAAWPGQDIQGAFAAAQVTLKFLQQECFDQRDLFREQFERWLYERAESSNAFEGAEWPVISFDPNSLTEPRLIREIAQLLWTMGASEESVLDTLGLNGEVEATRLRDFNKVLKEMGIEFVPRAARAPTAQTGRPMTVDQPTPERGQTPQPRPSTTQS